MAPLILPEALALRGLGQGTQLLRPPRALPPPNGHLHFMPNQIPQAPKEDRMLWALFSSFAFFGGSIGFQIFHSILIYTITVLLIHLRQWFSIGGDFVPLGTFGNVWRHFGCHNWGRGGC